MGVNVNNNEIKKMVFDVKEESNFPKNKAGKNDRVAMVKGIEHGHKYYGTLTVIYADWSEYKTQLTIEKLIQNREFVQVRDTGEGRFGTFVLLFNSLLAGTFKQEAQKQSDMHFERIEKMNREIAKANKETYEQRIIADKRGIEISILKGDVALLEGQCENQLMVIDEQKREIAILKDEVNKFNTKLVNNKTEKLVCNDDSLEQFLQMAETLANSKVNHETFKHIMKKQFEELFLK